MPVYAYVVGALALVGGIWYFKTHNTGPATAAPQTNYSAPGGVPLPFSDPGSGASANPPPTTFDNSGSSLALFPSQANFSPAPYAPTTSQAFAQSVQTPYQTANYNPAYVASPASQPSYSSQSLGVSSALGRIPILGGIVSALAGTPSSPGGYSGFNPVVPRSSGTRGV